MRILDRDSWTGTIRLHNFDKINRTEIVDRKGIPGHKWVDMSPQNMNHILCISNVKVLSPLMTIWV